MDAWDDEVETRSTMSSVPGPICTFTSPHSAGNGAKRLTGKQLTIDGAVPCTMSHVNMSSSFLQSFNHILPEISLVNPLSLCRICMQICQSTTLTPRPAALASSLQVPALAHFFIDLRLRVTHGQL